MESGYRILEHPSDLGIEAQGRTLAEAFEEAAKGLLSLIVDPASVQGREERVLQLEAPDAEQLLVKWLSELLYLYDGAGYLPMSFSVDLTCPGVLKARLWGEAVSPARHLMRTDVKAVTYHQLEVKDTPAGALLRIYLDI